MAILSPRPCISAGHGLSSRTAGQIDPGASVPSQAGANEASKVLGMAKRVMQSLNVLQAYGMKPYLRDAGYYAKADDDARAHDCDLFLELHLDSSTSKLAHGTGTFISPYATGNSRRFADALQAAVAGAIGRGDRGVKTASFAVLKPYTQMASVLLEIIFASNALDVFTLNSRLEKVELAIVNSILRYYGWKTTTKLPRKWTDAERKAYRPVGTAPAPAPTAPSAPTSTTAVETYKWLLYAETSPSGKGAATTEAAALSNKLIVLDGPSGPSDAILLEHANTREVASRISKLRQRAERNVVYMKPGDLIVIDATPDGDVRRLNKPSSTVL